MPGSLPSVSSHVATSRWLRAFPSTETVPTPAVLAVPDVAPDVAVPPEVAVPPDVAVPPEVAVLPELAVAPDVAVAAWPMLSVRLENHTLFGRVREKSVSVRDHFTSFAIADCRAISAASMAATVRGTS